MKFPSWALLLCFSSYSHALAADPGGPQQKSLSNCSSVKDSLAVGDGQNDDTNAVQNALKKLGDSQCLVFPRGTYLITDYLTISNKSNIRVVMLGSVKPVGALSNTNTAIFYFSSIDDLDFIPRIINQSYASTAN